MQKPQRCACFAPNFSPCVCSCSWQWRLQVASQTFNEKSGKPWGCLPFSKSFRKNRLENKWNMMTFWVVAAENFWEQRSIGRVVLFFLTERSKRKFVFHFFKIKLIFDTSFLSSRPFFSQWNWFVQMVNAIPGRNLPVLNFAYHLPKPRTDRFVHVNGKPSLFPYLKTALSLSFTFARIFCSTNS